jgi:lipoyl(octanoyl) transferase
VGAPLHIEERGCVPYAEALRLQAEAVRARGEGSRPDTLFLLEHPPVVTLGRGAREAHLLVPREALHGRGIEVFEVSRGGDVTYHAPGQLVGYPILDLAARGCPDLHAYLRRLEAVLCDALRALGVPPRVVAGRTGVFVDTADPAAAPRKIASIGVGARGWITSHGFALNVDLDLAGFANIVACGLADVRMTSIAAELGSRAPADLGRRAREAVAAAFLRHFGG